MKAGRGMLYVLICDSHGSCKSPTRSGEFLYVFFYISHYVCVPSLPMLRSDFKSQFHSEPYFFIWPTYFISHHPLILLPWCVLSFHFCVHFFFPKCVHIVHFSVMCSVRCTYGQVILGLLLLTVIWGSGLWLSIFIIIILSLRNWSKVDSG